MRRGKSRGRVNIRRAPSSPAPSTSAGISASAPTSRCNRARLSTSQPAKISTAPLTSTPGQASRQRPARASSRHLTACSTPAQNPAKQSSRATTGCGPGQDNVNLRVSKIWGFGHEKGQSGASSYGHDGGAGGATAGPALSVPTRGGIFGQSTTTSNRYNVTLGMSIRNLLNHNNPGPIIGDKASPLFGPLQSNARHAKRRRLLGERQQQKAGTSLRAVVKQPCRPGLRH